MTDKRCMTPGCEKKAHVRGLCHACREGVRKMVNRGEYTYDELEDIGIILPAQSRGLGKTKIRAAIEAAIAKVKGTP